MKATKSMKAPMKAKAGAKAITKSGLADKLATAVDLKKSQVMKVLGHLSEIGASEVVQAGKFVVPGLCMIKTREPQLRDNSFCFLFVWLLFVALVCADIGGVCVCALFGR